MRGKGALSPRQVEYIHSVLRRALNQAVLIGLIPRNVAMVVNKPPKEPKPIKTWCYDDINRFLKAAHESRVYPLYVLACDTGMRRGELLGLQWEDINFEDQTISIQRSMVPAKGGYDINVPKSRKSERIIVITHDNIVALRTWRKRQLEEKVAFGSAYNPSDFVFCSPVGEPIKFGFLRRDFKAIKTRAGVPDINFHSIRHSHATLLYQDGFDFLSISQRLGHSDPAFTARVYTHPDLRNQRAIANNIAGKRKNMAK